MSSFHSVIVGSFQHFQLCSELLLTTLFRTILGGECWPILFFADLAVLHLGLILSQYGSYAWLISKNTWPPGWRERHDCVRKLTHPFHMELTRTLHFGGISPGGGGTLQSFIMGGSPSPRSNRLSFCIPLWEKRYPFQVPLLGKR